MNQTIKLGNHESVFDIDRRELNKVLAELSEYRYSVFRDKETNKVVYRGFTPSSNYDYKLEVMFEWHGPKTVTVVHLDVEGKPEVTYSDMDWPEYFEFVDAVNNKLYNAVSMIIS